MTYIHSYTHQFTTKEERNQYWIGLYKEMVQNPGKYTDLQMSLIALECRQLGLEESLIASADPLQTAPKKLKCGPILDVKFYERLKPYLLDTWKEAKSERGNASETLDTFVDKVIEKMGDKVVPYMKWFYREVKAGDLANTVN